MSSLLKAMKYQTYKPQISPIETGTIRETYWQYVRAHLIYIVFALIFLTGMLLGVLLLHNATGESREMLRLVIGGYLDSRKSQDFSTLALYAFATSAAFLIVLFFCGFCNISQPIILLLLLFRGAGYGFSLGGLYAEKGIEAIGYIGVLIFMPMLCGTLLLVCAARGSFLLSIRLWRRATQPSELDERYRMRRYCIRYFLYIVVTALISLLEAGLAIRFQNSFFF